MLQKLSSELSGEGQALISGLLSDQPSRQAVELFRPVSMLVSHHHEAVSHAAQALELTPGNQPVQTALSCNFDAPGWSYLSCVPEGDGDKLEKGIAQMVKLALDAAGGPSKSNIFKSY